MSMTKNRRSVYRRSWWRRNLKVVTKLKKKESHRKIRHSKLTEDSISRGSQKQLRSIDFSLVDKE